MTQIKTLEVPQEFYDNIIKTMRSNGVKEGFKECKTHIIINTDLFMDYIALIMPEVRGHPAFQFVAQKIISFYSLTQLKLEK